MDYQYWIIRFVPDVARGEFTNIGIVCGREAGDWAVKFDTRFVKSHGDLTSDLRELKAWTNWFRETVESQAREHLEGPMGPKGASWIRSLSTRLANGVQLSAPTPIHVSSAREGLSLLFPRLVVREPLRRNRSRTRRTLRSELRDVLVNELDFVVGRNLFMQPRAAISKQQGAFDALRVTSGSDVLTNVWAFNVATLETLETEIQSWNFLVSRLRQDGAALTRANGTQPSSVPSDVPIEVIYDAPSIDLETQWRSDIFEAALEAWAINGVVARTRDEFHEVAHSGDLVTFS